MFYKSEVSTDKLQILGGGNGHTGVRVLEVDNLGYANRASGTAANRPSAKAGYAMGCTYTATDNGAVYRNTGSITSATWTLQTPVAVNSITPVYLGTRTVVALADAAATPTIAQLMTSSIFTITPTVARTFTTPTAAAIVAGVTGATVGSWFDFTIVNSGVVAVTVTAGDAGVTIVGDAAVNKGSASYRALLTNVTGGAEAVSIIRLNDAVASLEAPLADGHIFVGNSNGVAADVAMSGDVTIADTGATTLAVPKVYPIVSQSLVFSNFTDNLDATGYIDITTQIPAGSIVLGWKAVVSAGFTGNVSATVQVGIAGTLDKYSVVTSNSVFAAATVGATVKAGNVFEPAAITARVTVTGSSDFTAINAGTMVVTLYVIKTA